MTNYRLQVFLILFYHLKENQLSIRISSFSLKSERKRWKKSCNGDAVHFDASMVYADFELGRGYVKLFSDFQSFQLNISSCTRNFFILFFSLILTHFPVRLLKPPVLGCWEDFL